MGSRSEAVEEKRPVRRKFNAHHDRFILSRDERREIAGALSRDAVPDEGIGEVEEAIRRAIADVALNMDVRRTLTMEGQESLTTIAELGCRLADELKNVDDEVQHYLDFEVPYGTTEDLARLKGQLRRARERHERDLENLPPPDEGAPSKGAALRLALELAVAWAAHSGRGWSHRGAWGHFVSLAFGHAGVDASAESMARKAAKQYRQREREPGGSRRGEN